MDHDERIRKKLIKTIGYFRSRGIDQQLCEEFLAYLEKQEQKPIIKGWVARDKALQLNFYTNKPKRGKTHWIENGGDSVQIMPDTEHLYEEQNFDTLDWKDEPIEVELVVRASTEKRQEHVPENEETGTRQEQKSAEWSDTNELVFKDICKHLKEEGYNGWVEILEALHNREPKQPIAVWSDGNKQWFDAIIKDYEDLLSGDEDHDPAIQIKINLLKSLRPQPHWKPSEEQMEALHKAAKKAYHDYDARPLESLYSDLLKLKSL